MLSALFIAIACGLITYGIVKILLLSFAWLKNRIAERLKARGPQIGPEAVISVTTVLENAPMFSLESFGPNIQMDDFLMMSVKADGSIEEKIDVVRAKQIDDDVKAAMKKCGGAIKIAG